MPDKTPNSRGRSPRRQTVSADRGIDHGGIQAAPATGSEAGVSPPLIDAELVQLRIRVIALENIVIALLAQAPEGQLALSRKMAAHISPRDGYTPHPTTLHAAAEINSLVRRADAFRSGRQAEGDEAQAA